MKSDNELLDIMRSEAASVAERLSHDPSTLAVILSGPLAAGKASEGDKLYFAVITDREDGVIEHHFLDEGWEGAHRQIEMGKFPVAVARYLIEHGYSDMVSYKSLEAFRCGQVIWERDGVGAEIVEGSERHIPSKSFIGESLHGAVSALDDAVSLLRNGDYANAVLVAREAATKAVGMVVAERMKSADCTFLEAAGELLAPVEFERYLAVMGLEGTDHRTASENAGRALEFARYALREIGVDPDHFIPDGQKGTAV